MINGIYLGGTGTTTAIYHALYTIERDWSIDSDINWAEYGGELEVRGDDSRGFELYLCFSDGEDELAFRLKYPDSMVKECLEFTSYHSAVENEEKFYRTGLISGALLNARAR